MKPAPKSRPTYSAGEVEMLSYGIPQGYLAVRTAIHSTLTGYILVVSCSKMF
jgi:hypothetical protein